MLMEGIIMKVSRFKVLIIMCAILLPLMSCTEKEDKTNNGNNENKSMEVSQNNLSNEENDNKDNHSIEVYMMNLSQKEYVKWVVKSHDGGLGSNGEQLTLPEITNFDYPYIEGIEDIELKNKINQTIKDAIFNVDFFSEPMRGVGISTPPYSEYEFPGIILFNDILSIPITLYYDYEKDIYKSISVTIDLKTGKRLYLEDIIKLNERLAKNILYEDDFFIDIKGVIMMKEYLDNYFDANEVAQSEASKQLLDTLRNYMPKDEKPKIEEFYLTKDGLVLTKFANNSPMEINIPIRNLKDFLKIKSWERNSVLL